MTKRVFILYVSLFFYSFMQAQCNTRNYHFDGSISREVLENYLRRSITFSLSLDRSHQPIEESLRFIQNTRPKFIGRVIGLWGSENRIMDKQWLDNARNSFNEILKIDSTIVLQCAMFEIITDKVNQVPIPHWVFREFDLPVEKRNFRYEDMLLDAGRYSEKDYWNKNQSVPNIVKLETQMWFYFLAATYIDLGIEAIHFGQVNLMGSNDNANLDSFYSTVSRIRNYASEHARRHWVIIDAHTPLGGIRNNKQELLFDFHSFPVRMREVPEQPQHAILDATHLDAIYKGSMGGITPSGWQCENLPYLVEIDNYGQSAHPGKPGSKYYVWGWDEITWFINQPEAYRNGWLKYAWKWIRKEDANGYLQMPGWRGKYRANTASNSCPDGFNQEETIKAIWDNDDVQMQQ